jgi:hypothetical protein
MKSVFADGAAAMNGSIKGFVAFAKNKNPK